MKVTNKFGLPAPFVAAATPKVRPSERRGGADISVTELIGPPRIKQLVERHWEDIEIDSVERLYAIFGDAIHGVLQDFAGTNRAEKRIIVTIDGMTISGKFDLFEGDGMSVLSDWKSTSAWHIVFGGSEEWEKQINCYRYMLKLNGMGDPVKLQNVAFIRDWSRREAERDPERYPQCPVIVVNQPVWPDDKILAFMKGRVEEHRKELPECTASERWIRDESWAATIKGRKRALAVRDSDEAIKAFIEGYKKDYPNADIEVEHRKGSATRCKGYCDAWKFCEFGLEARGLLEEP